MESTSISCKNGSAQNLQSKNFVHLHQHTTYSFLDGYNPIKKAVARIKELGMTAAAITDHNHLAGIPEWKEECEANGIKPLLGYEGYYTEDMSMASLPVEERKIYAYLSALENGDINESCGSLLKGFNIDTFRNDMVKISNNEMKPSEFLKIYKPLFSLVEQYIYDMRQYHILFIAKNQAGWKNLVKIQSESARLCTYNGRYLCDMNLLRKYSDGVICTTACIGSRPARYLEIGREDKAEEYIVSMKEIFGDNFYLEIQPLVLDKQIKTNLFYMKMSKKYNIKCIATNDVHYTLKGDHDDHDTLLCIGTGQYKTEEIAHKMWEKSKTRTAEFKYNRMQYSNDFWIKSYGEMIDSFETQSEDIPDSVLEEYKKFYLKALEETNCLADKVEAIELGSKTPLFSNFKPPAGYTPERYLTRLAYSGMYKYLSEHSECDVKTYEKRLAEELAVINPKGFAPYMLAVWEYANWANAHGCVTGPGRGSAAGSLVLFSIGITKNIDPIKNKLWFSRFLTADRKDLPDVDLDFSWENRDSVIKHLEDYYGKTKVSHIGTYTTLGVKNGLKDVGRVLGMEFMEMNNISKKIDEISDKPSVSFSDLDALKDGTEGEKTNYLKFFELESKYKELFRLARAFEGIPRNTGVHASGILVTPMDVSDLFPLRYLSDGTAVTLYTGPQLEQNKAVKYDLLGLKTLDIITKTLNHINDIKDIEELYKMADITDKKVWNLIREKNTDAVFQIESNMMKGIIESIQPDRFDDLVAINSIGRPGPVSIGLNTKYGNVKNDKAQPEYPIRDCEDILDETYSYPIYQEQLMAISKKVSGFDDSQADSITRKVLAKKRRALFPLMKRCHIYGKLNVEGPEGWEEDDNAPWYDPKGKYGKEIPGGLVNGYTAEEINNYFDKIEGFANYCFNKAHAACYAYIGFLCAWLKAYYPAEFMAAVLSMAADEKIAVYINICEKKLGIKITPPDINISGRDFTPDKNRILYGLGAVKGVGEASLPSIIENAPYKSIEDAVKRIPKKAFNKRIAENLIKSGAFDFDDPNRNEILNRLHKARKDKGEDFLSPDKYTRDIVMKYEEDTLGTHISCHTWWEDLDSDKTTTLKGAKVKKLSEQVDKKGNLMAFGTMSYDKVDFHMLVFASKYSRLRSLFDTRLFKTVTVSGKKDDKGTFIISDAVPDMTLAEYEAS